MVITRFVTDGLLDFLCQLKLSARVLVYAVAEVLQLHDDVMLGSNFVL